MTEMLRESNINENIEESQITDTCRKQIENAMDNYSNDIRFKKVKIKNNSSERKISLLHELEEKFLKLQAKIEFRTSKKGKEQMNRILMKIVNTKVPNNDLSNKIKFHDQTTYYLMRVMFELDEFNFEKIEQTLIELEKLKQQVNIILKDNFNMKRSLEYSIEDLSHLLKLQETKLIHQKRLTKIK